MINLSQIEKIYTNGPNTFRALKGIDLEINKGEFITVIGRSGSGKSSLLNIIGLLDSYERGTYTFNGKDMNEISVKELVKVRSREMGFIFQMFNLLKNFSALENVEVPLGYAGVSKKKRYEIAREVLEAVGLGDKVNNRPSELSGGQQQRVAIARALVHSPKLILADEPTGNLDLETAKQIMDLLGELNVKKGISIIMVTHDLELIADQSRVLKLEDGKII